MENVFVRNKALKKKQKRKNPKTQHNVKRKKICTNTRKSSEPLRAGSLTNSPVATNGWKTDTVTQHCWCTWWQLHVTLGPFNLIVRCIPAAQCTSSGKQWATNEQFTYVWPPATKHRSINQASATATPPGFVSPLTHTVSCLLSSSARAVLAACASNAPTLPITSSLHCNILQWLAQTADSQRWQKCFYIFTHKCFASCSWCGGGPHVTMEGDEDIEAQLWG